MKIKFESNDNLSINNIVNMHQVAVIIRSVKMFSSVIFRWCTLWITKMLWYQKVDISEGIDINKTNASKECEVCHY